MRHFKFRIPVFPNKDHYLIHGPEIDAFVTTDEEEARTCAQGDMAHGKMLQVLRFNPADPSEPVRDMTADFLPEDEPITPEHRPRIRIRPPVLTTTEQYASEAKRMG